MQVAKQHVSIGKRDSTHHHLLWVVVVYRIALPIDILISRIVTAVSDGDGTKISITRVGDAP